MNVELEQILISALLQEPSLIYDCDLEPTDFEVELFAWAFDRFKDLYAQKQDFSIADLMQHVDDDSLQTLREISDSCFSPSISVVRDLSLQIRTASEKKKILSAVMSITPNMSLSEIKDILAFTKRDDRKSSIMDGKQVLQVIKDSLEMPPTCYRTGLPQLDHAMGGGLYESFVYGLCGAEKSGKTTLAHTISYNLDCPHLYVALEMGSQYIEQRNISRKLGVNSLEFLNKREKMREKVSNLEPRENTFYMDAQGQTLSEILAESTRAIAKHGIKGVILDYWQLVGGQNSRMTEEKHLRDVAQGLADFAKKHKVWVIILAQMNSDGKLFGGGGLKKACEQLYMIRHDEFSENMRWLEMDASRYTLKCDVGSEGNPSLVMEINSGPYFRER